MNKIKYKRKTKRIKLKYIFLILSIFLISLGIAYSKFSTDLVISGNVKGEIKKYTQGNSLYTYTIRSSWQGSNDGTIIIYDVYVPILNLDDDYTESIEIEFDISDGFLLDKSTNNCNIWQAESITQIGNRIKIIFKDYACWLLNGSTLDLYFQLPYQSQSEVEISNITLNGKLAEFVTEFPK